MTRSGPLVVVGDVLLDIDITGRADRAGPGAAVPVVDFVSRRTRPGGAGLAALLAAAATPEVVLVGAFGGDAGAERLRRLLAGRVRVTELLLHGSTVRRQRVRTLGGSAPTHAPDGPATDRAAESSAPRARAPAAVARVLSGSGRAGTDPLPGSARAALRSAGAILVADHGRGVTAHPELRALLAQRARQVPIAWAPHPYGSTPVPGVALATPDRSYAAALVPGPFDSGIRARELVRRWESRSVAVTLGAHGAVFYRHGARAYFPIPVPRQLYVHGSPDAYGAGDMFAVTAATALHTGHGLAYAVRRAVESAAEFVWAGAVSGTPPVRDLQQHA
ncbi:PfkB family carbohydrate kinase [Nocardia sp. N2S4-5]|uniref:PfkB family carbohydrate kinase n=1 Tax=Nocardia sp. N2S4-5 TaxID=3351565 RepID=UPI0037CE15BE